MNIIEIFKKWAISKNFNQLWDEKEYITFSGRLDKKDIRITLFYGQSYSTASRFSGGRPSIQPYIIFECTDFISSNELWFTIGYENILNKIGKHIGFSDILIGDKEFDNKFLLTGSPRDKVKRFLTYDLIERIKNIPNTTYKVSHNLIRIRYENIFELSIDNLDKCFFIFKDFLIKYETMNI